MKGRLGAEAAVRQKLRVAMAREIRVLVRLGRALKEQAAAFETAQEPFAVLQRSICGRLADDLRVIEWAMTAGYPLQAWSLAASVHELACTSGMVGADDELARRWLSWTNPKQVPWNTHEVEVGLDRRLRRARNDDPPSPATFRAYTALAIAKHGNPLVQKAAFVSTTAAAHRLNNDPEFSPQRIRQGRTITYLATLPVVRALLVLRNEGILSAKAERNFEAAAHDWAELAKSQKERTPKP